MSTFNQDLEQIKNNFEQEFEKASSQTDFENLKNKYLGRKGSLAEVMKKIGSVPASERGAAGKLANEVKTSMTAKISQKSGGESGDGQGFFDLTEPGKAQKMGHPHPYTLVRDEVTDIFRSMGFEVLDGEEVTTDYYCFESLNIPKGHPARDAWDTFYIKQQRKKNEDLVLRTHTSSMQVAVMEEEEPPLRKVVIGRCFRNEATDASHEHSFNQIEGFVVDENISVANLVSTLKQFLQALFKAEMEVRLRPGFFPFVEPGYELDFKCLNCKGEGCKVCKHSGWVEFLGCGMIHPKVLNFAGYPKGKYTGYAFGMGFDRITMMKYKIDDIRLFNGGDLRFIHQF
ncbi:phenylalanine--tRNA ligase subunit alpha [Patescibacteria group bacterium]|nr:phenylalanine--tRNA ligase subunit alpha [Patescibacteria group bacterium]